MGFFERLFGKPKQETSRQGTIDDPDVFLRMALGEGQKAKRSSTGHPVCPNCGKEFPVSAEAMERESDGIPVFACPSCGKMIKL